WGSSGSCRPSSRHGCLDRPHCVLGEVELGRSVGRGMMSGRGNGKGKRGNRAIRPTDKYRTGLWPAPCQVAVTLDGVALFPVFLVSPFFSSLCPRFSRSPFFSYFIEDRLAELQLAARVADPEAEINI